MNEDQVVAGARDAAKELGYEITATSIDHQGAGQSAYGFAFDAGGLQANVDLLVSATDVARFGLTLRDYARWEILDALREPEANDQRPRWGGMGRSSRGVYKSRLRRNPMDRKLMVLAPRVPRPWKWGRTNQTGLARDPTGANRPR